MTHPTTRRCAKLWAQRNKEKMDQYQQKWANANPWRRVFNSARTRAMERGIPFTITIDDLGEYPSRCPVLGVPLSKGGRPWCASIDRIDPTKGYTKDNIVIVSYFVNRVKNDATIDQLREIADFYKRLMERSK